MTSKQAIFVNGIVCFQFFYYSISIFINTDY